MLEQDATAADVEQMALPLGDPDGELTPADEPPEWPSELALNDRTRDRRLLGALTDTCRAAARSERKIAALRRLLTRVKEPAIVFTEYRDTLMHVREALESVAPVVVLHGGMKRDERVAALAIFEQGQRTVLLATDAAGEGLNLQRGCRLVVNLELPWNPMRLEQRIGRVDRIGQARTVHAVHLVAHRTGELDILDRLRHRVARAREDIGAPDPVGPSTRLRAGGGFDEPDQSEPPFDAAPMGPLVSPEFHSEARVEVDRLQHARAMTRRLVAEHRRAGPVDPPGPLVVQSSRAGLRAALGTKALLVWRLSWENQAGGAVESTIVAVTIAGVPKAASRAEVRCTVREIAGAVASAIESLGSTWRDKALEATRALVATRLARERAILASMPGALDNRFQPGLFDRRAERRRHLLREQAADLTRQIADRIALVERTAAISSGPPALLLAVLP